MHPKQVMVECPYCQKHVLVPAEVEELGGLGGLGNAKESNIRRVPRICPECKREILVMMEVIWVAKQVIILE